ncbi:MAG: class I tRNA ligase family protein [Planctomycetota bacterium]
MTPEPTAKADAAPATSDISGDTPRHRYTAALAGDIELRWQRKWAETDTFRVPNPGEPGFDAGKPKFFVLDMFPYPSGAGLHVGHPEGYTATDILGRYKRMAGFNVLHPMGWDAFGLPAEQYAIQTGVHPAETTRTAIDNFRRQLQRFGFAYDWSREFATIDPDYYRWTQWIFAQMYDAWFDIAQRKGRPIAELIAEFADGSRAVRINPDASEHSREDKRKTWPSWDDASDDDKHTIINSYRLTYLGEQTVNWCPKLGTALANEEVIDGRSERGGHPVLRKPLRQWMFRITAYGDRLLAGLEHVDWPDSTRTQQAEWIGRSEGTEIDFELVGFDQTLTVYTTRPDTLFGATYMVVAPEHPLVDRVLQAPTPETDADALRTYVDAARNRSDVDRQEAKDKTGVFTGVYATNPATGDKIPVWTADYVLMGYGSGAIMAVPAHDERDFEFAKQFGLPIRDVVYPTVIAAMDYYRKHATDAERSSSAWMSVLANMLALVASETRTAAQFEETLEIVRTRRKGDPQLAAVQIGDAVKDLPGAIGEQRGAATIVWLDALETLGFDTFDAMNDRFERRAFHATAGEAFTGRGVAWNSSNAEVSLDGLQTPDAKAKMTEWVESAGVGSRKTNFKLRDWLFSRQRYWGEPFPIVFDEHGRHHRVADDALPVELPPLTDYEPVESDEPLPLLGKAKDWKTTTAGDARAASALDDLPTDATVTREVNTMPGWAGSCWYYLRYCDPKNAGRFVGEQAERYWLGHGTDRPGVDLYIGGSEHAVLHLLYARFWHQALYDLGHVSSPEPFGKLFHQGLILSHAYQRDDKSLVPIDEVAPSGDGSYVHTPTGDTVQQTIAKMSKTLKNVVNPDDIIEQFGADTFRLYEMYLGPLEANKPWNTDDIIGLHRFLQRVWRLSLDEDTGQLKLRDEADGDVEKQLHRTIAKVGDDIERLSFNTAIAAMIELVNAAYKPGMTADQLGRFMRMLSPFAPHLAEEIWARLGIGDGFCMDQPWPSYDEAMLRDDEVEVPVQIMGKLRARVMVPADADADAMQEIAMADDRIAELIAGKTVRKVIAVPGRMVNIVAN